MRVDSLKVEGFRSLRDVAIPIGPMTAFIGPNGSGKSSALLALKLLFTPGQAVEEEDFWCAADGTKADEITIAVTFSDLTESEQEVFSRYLSDDGDLTIERVFTEPGRGTYLVSRMGVEEFARIRSSPKGQEHKPSL